MPKPSMPRLLLLLFTWLTAVSAIRMFEANSLNSCMQDSKFGASFFHVVFTPDNATVFMDINGNSAISGKVLLEVQVSGYGYDIVKKVIDPCTTEQLKGLCPMTAAPIHLAFNTPLPADAISKAPGVIYYVPDIDAKVRVLVNTTGGEMLACVEAHIDNGQTVNQKGVAWAVAIIALLGLIISAIMSGLGHSNTATHVASNSLSLFSYFQAQAFIGMTAIPMPPIVRAWTQNFQWSMGIIKVDFLQTMATWYQRATGGTPTSLLSTLATTSVQVQKRALDVFAHMFGKRVDTSSNSETLKVISVMGIERVGFVAEIEESNIFFTSYTFLWIFIIFIVVGVVLFRYICEALVRSGKMRENRFAEFRQGWTVVLKGILYRIALIVFPQVVVLCLWELTQRDSPAECVLAVCTFLTVTGLLGYGSWKVWSIARRSISVYHNPAYVLYSDPRYLNKWGFLYVQFSATTYYFIMPILLIVFVKGCFIAFGQTAGLAQAIGLVVLELALLILLSVFKPYMDKMTNSYNIAIASVGFVNVLFLLFFTGDLGVPPLAIGIMGVLYFILNVIFSLVILIMGLWASIRALVSKNPDARYQPMGDDRGSFIKSQTDLRETTELDALGAAARGDNSVRGAFLDPTRTFSPEKRMTVEEEELHDSRRSSASMFSAAKMKPMPPPPVNTNSPYMYQRGPMDSNTSVPLTRPMASGGYPSQGGFPVGPPGGSESSGYNAHAGQPSPFSSTNPLYRPNSPYRPRVPPQRSASPWQRGVGY